MKVGMRNKKGGYQDSKKRQDEENKSIRFAAWLGSNHGILCILTTIVALFPVSCNYIMTGGIVQEWIFRVEELAGGLQKGCFYLYPNLNVLSMTGIYENAMNSNFWFLVPGFLYGLTKNIVLSYRLYMLAVQIITFLTASLFFLHLFGQDGRLAACMGIVLYMTNPYRIYVCYDHANLSQATAWMLLPLYAWAMYTLTAPGKKVGKLLVAGASLAFLGYADVIFFLTAAGITLLVAIISRRGSFCFAVMSGGILFFPGLYRLCRYLFTEDFIEWNIPLQMIMGKGYRFGQFFSSYAFRDGKPGMGLGMMICLLAAVWMRFVYREGEKDKGKRGFLYIALFLSVLSLSSFPWDVLQRLGNWAVRLISLINTPSVLWGMAIAAFCIPAAAGMERLFKGKDRTAAIVTLAAAVLLCVGICVYQCNMLTYTRLPLELGG